MCRCTYTHVYMHIICTPYNALWITRLASTECWGGCAGARRARPGRKGSIYLSVVSTSGVRGATSARRPP